MAEPYKRKHIGGAIAGAFFGGLFGLGLALFLSQMDLLDITRKTSLWVPALCLVLGFLAGYYGGRPRKQPG